jgi:hypothetical protein
MIYNDIYELLTGYYTSKHPMKKYRCYLRRYDHELCIGQVNASDKYSTVISSETGYFYEVQDCLFLAKKLFSSGQDLIVTGRYRVEALD